MDESPKLTEELQARIAHCHRYHQVGTAKRFMDYTFVWSQATGSRLHCRTGTSGCGDAMRMDHRPILKPSR